MTDAAVAAKARAMYGRRLEDTDFARLSSLSSLADVLAYLKTCPGWSKALIHISPHKASRSRLEEALKTQLMQETLRLCRFAGRLNQSPLLFSLHRYELECILSALRRISSPGGVEERSQSPPDLFDTCSKLDFEKLKHATHWRDIVLAGEASIYKKALRKAPVSVDTGKPLYLALDSLLLGRYYSHLYQFAQKARPLRIGAFLRHAVGSEADLLNLSHIQRVKGHSPQQISLHPDKLLIPVFYKLSPAFFQRFWDAADKSSAMNLLKDTAYATLFSKRSFPRIEQYADWYLGEINRKHLRGHHASPYVPAAYLHLKGRELTQLVRIIQETHYKSERQAVWQLSR